MAEPAIKARTRGQGADDVSEEWRPDKPNREMQLASLLMMAAFKDRGQMERRRGLGPLYLTQAKAILSSPHYAGQIVALLNVTEETRH